MEKEELNEGETHQHSREGPLLGLQERLQRNGKGRTTFKPKECQADGRGGAQRRRVRVDWEGLTQGRNLISEEETRPIKSLFPEGGARERGINWGGRLKSAGSWTYKGRKKGRRGDLKKKPISTIKRGRGKKKRDHFFQQNARSREQGKGTNWGQSGAGKQAALCERTLRKKKNNNKITQKKNMTSKGTVKRRKYRAFQEEC